MKTTPLKENKRTVNSSLFLQLLDNFLKQPNLRNGTGLLERILGAAGLWYKMGNVPRGPCAQGPISKAGSETNREIKRVLSLLLQMLVTIPVFLFHTELYTNPGSPDGSVVKNLSAKVGDAGLIPGLGRSPGEGNDNPLWYSCRETHGQRSLVGYCPWGGKRVRHILGTKQYTQTELKALS